MNTIHYATGGLITPEMSEFSTLCGRKFPTGGKDIMDAGYSGRQRITCKDCLHRLELSEKTKAFLDGLQKLVDRAYRDQKLAQKLMFAIVEVKGIF